MLFKKTGGVSWLIVFLGNPGPRYEMTRHNAGFMAADAMAKEMNLSINKSRFKALTASCQIGEESVLLMKPQTFMNLSGDAVSQAAKFYKIPPERVIVVSDEISLPIGKLRIRTKGSAGGHNGLKDIIAKLGTDAFPRIRIGVGAPRTRTMIWRTGCCPPSKTRTRRICLPPPPERPRRPSATSPRGRSGR